MTDTTPTEPKPTFWQSFTQLAEFLDETPEDRLRRHIQHLEARIEALEAAAARADTSDA